MRKIELTQGQVAIVDDSDYGNVSQFEWCAQKIRRMFYAKRRGSSGETVYLHRYLMNAQPGQKVDHRDGDGLNCLRRNMRLATQSQNGWGARKKAKNTSSKFFGVSWHRKTQKWRAYIGDPVVHLGLFDSEVEAAEAYNMAALAQDPHFRHLNYFYESVECVNGQITRPA